LKFIPIPNERGLFRQSGFMRLDIRNVIPFPLTIPAPDLAVAPFKEHTPERFPFRIVVQMPDCLLLRILGIYGALRPATALTLTNSILRLRKPRLAPFEGSQDYSIGKSGAAESVKTVAEKGGEIV